MFKIEIIGNLGADAEVKNEQGTKFVSFRVAHTDKWSDGSGQERQDTTWIDCLLNNVDSRVIPYLRQGVKVFVRGYGRLRVYSSAKEHKMKAGISCSVQEIELCGGSSEDVPRTLVVPETGALVNVTKHYWVPIDTKKMQKDEVVALIDTKGNEYLMNKGGFVVPAPSQQENQSQNQADSKA